MSSTLWLRGRALAGHVLPGIAAEFRARRSAHSLHRLSDRMLADIGISRGEIDAAVRGLDPLARRG